jgi:N-sulfoglucosamine sulfohydrolase
MKKQTQWMLAAAATGTLFPMVGKTAQTEQPNILLIIADDLGPTLGCYGDATAKTPYIDQVAAAGVRFNQAHVTAASCSPSRGSIMTGLYPHQHGMFGLSQQGWAQMHDDVPKLPNELKKLGYRTAIIGKTHFEPFNLFQFDYVETDGQKVIMQRDVRWMNSKADGFLKEQPKNQPFFLVVSYVDPHRGGGDGRYGPDKNEKFPRIRMGLPENPPTPEETQPIPFLGVDSPELRMEDSDYYSCVQRLDTGVGELLKIIKNRQLLENTVIVLVGDNGPDITRGKMSSYATATRVPMLVYWHGHTDVGLVRDEPVSTIDLFPTFISAAGGKITDERQTGLPLQSLLTGGKKEWRTQINTEFITHVPWHYYPRYTVLNGKYHFIYNTAALASESPLEPHNFCSAWWEVQKPAYDGTAIRKVYDHVKRPPEFELFDLQNDPFEFNNLADNPEYKDMVEQMTREVKTWRVETKDPFLDPEFGAAFQKHVEQMKAAYDAKNGVRKAPAKEKSKKPNPESAPVPAEKISVRDGFETEISKDWNFPGNNSGVIAKNGGVQTDLSRNGLGMNRQVSEAGIFEGTVEVSAVFVQGNEAAPHDINWNVGVSTDNSKYLQNMGEDTVCVRFLTAGENKGRLRWALSKDGKSAAKSYSPENPVSWNPDDEICLTLEYDLATGVASATAQNVTTGKELATDTVSCPGICGFRYAGVEMTLFPKEVSGPSSIVKRFVFKAEP